MIRFKSVITPDQHSYLTWCLDQPDDRKINHSQGWRDCSVGDYARELGADMSGAVEWLGFARRICPDSLFDLAENPPKARAYIPTYHDLKEYIRNLYVASEGEVNTQEEHDFPPVGTLVDRKLTGNWLGPARLIHVTRRGIAVIEYEGGINDGSVATVGRSVNIRPHLSDEDRAVEEMLETVGKNAGKAESVRRSVCRRLYRAGYRK